MSDRVRRNDRRRVGRHSQEARVHPELLAVGVGTRTAELPPRTLTHTPRRHVQPRPTAPADAWYTPSQPVVTEEQHGHSRGRIIAIAMAITAVLLITAAVVGLKGGPARPTLASTVTATVQVTTTVTATVRPAAAVPSTLTPSVGPSPAETFSDGTHLVPAEMTPGTYQTSGPAGANTCHYERDKNLDGGSDSITADGDITGPTTLIIYTWDAAVRFSGGCSWHKIADAGQ